MGIAFIKLSYIHKTCSSGYFHVSDLKLWLYPLRDSLSLSLACSSKNALAAHILFFCQATFQLPFKCQCQNHVKCALMNCHELAIYLCVITKKK